jgi:hypothetical protein
MTDKKVFKVHQVDTEKKTYLYTGVCKDDVKKKSPRVWACEVVLIFYSIYSHLFVEVKIIHRHRNFSYLSGGTCLPQPLLCNQVLCLCSHESMFLHVKSCIGSEISLGLEKFSSSYPVLKPLLLVQRCQPVQFFQL